MSNPYIGEIRMFAGNFAPAGWAFCNGALLPISEYDTLFNLIGTTYGGDGESTFALPNLQGRVLVHQGTGGGGTFTIGEMAGSEEVTLTVNQIPSHSHVPLASTIAGTLPNPGDAIFAAGGAGEQMYSTPPGAVPAATLAPNNILPTGGSQPHENMGPYLCVNFILSLFGRYPNQ